MLCLRDICFFKGAWSEEVVRRGGEMLCGGWRRRMWEGASVMVKLNWGRLWQFSAGAAKWVGSET